MTDQVAPLTQAPGTAIPAAESQKVMDTSKPKLEKLRIDGKDVEVSIDELKRAYGLHAGAEKKFMEAARLRKEAEEVREVFGKKDVSALLKAGWTEDEIEQKAAEYLVAKQLEKNMTPEQRAQKAREEEYKRLKQSEEDRIRLEKEKGEKDIQQREAKLYQTAFMTDLAKADNKSWLDLNDPIVITHIINDITSALKTHNYDMGVDEAVHRLEQQMGKKGPTKKEYLKKLLKHTITDIDDADLDAFLEKGGAGIREKSSEIYKKSSPFDKKTTPQTQTETPKKLVRDEAYYKAELQKSRDMRYGRLK